MDNKTKIKLTEIIKECRKRQYDLEDKAYWLSEHKFTLEEIVFRREAEQVRKIIQYLKSELDIDEK